MLITSIENKKIKNLKKLQIKKYRDDSDYFLIEGKHLVEEAYKLQLLHELILEENEEYSLDVQTTYVTKPIINYLSEVEKPTNIIGVCKKNKEKEIGNRVLMLDSIQDPGNLGTIIRSAVAFNIDTIILSLDTVDLYNSKVIRSCQGMMFNLNIIIRDLRTEIIELKKKGYKIIGTKVTNGIDAKTLEKKDKLCIIMGNEGNGISKEIIDLCDNFIYIRMNNKCESLNVGVATSIILYELDK